MQRAAFNRALGAADINAIAPLLAQNAVLVTGSDSAVIAGRKAQILAWKREFAVADRTVYTRLPDRIEASAVEPVALEYGHWQGITESGRPLASGTYCAKWRKIGADWVIEAEIFVTLA
jgi:ketosteroid isomerase-like protein